MCSNIQSVNNVIFPFVNSYALSLGLKIHRISRDTPTNKFLLKKSSYERSASQHFCVSKRTLCGPSSLRNVSFSYVP